MNVLLILLLIAAVLAIAAFAVGEYFYNFAISSTGERPGLFAPEPELTAEQKAAKEAEQRQNDEFNAAHPAESLYLDPSHGKPLRLHARLYRQVPACHRWAVVVHGYGCEGGTMLPEVQRFYGAGYNVLLPDLRGHGRSEGDYIGMGWPDHYDILDWIAKLTELDPNAEILLYGVSMGAATVMDVTGEALPANVKVAVEDCGYTSIKDIFIYHLKRVFHLPPFPLLYIVDAAVRRRAGYSILAPGPVDMVAKSKTPTLFIHGDKDAFVPYFMLDKVYTAAACPKEKLVIEGAAHAKAAKTAPGLYWQTVFAFAAGYMQ